MNEKFSNVKEIFENNYDFYLSLILNADDDNGTNFFESEFVKKYFRTPKEKKKKELKKKKSSTTSYNQFSF